MRALKKAILSCMAVGALATVVAASAFAAETTATYENGKVSSGLDFSTYNSDQMTVIVIEKGADDDGITADEILYIDQNAADADAVFQNMGVRANYAEGDVDAEGAEIKGDGTLKYGTYVVKIGGENVDEIIVAEFTVGPNGITLQYGDCDTVKGVVDTGDITAIIDHMLGISLLTGNDLTAADCDTVKGVVDTGDITAVIDHMLGNSLLGTFIGQN